MAETAPPVTHLSIRDLAAREGVAEQTVRHWRMKGYGPRSFVIGGRLIRYRLEDVIEWENQQLTESA